MLSFANAPTDPQDYQRSLDIAHAVARVTYKSGGVRFTREYFASYPDGVIVMRIAADHPGKINFKVVIAEPDNRSIAAQAKGGRITVSGALKDNALKYEAQLQVVAQGGKLRDASDGAVTVTGANSAVLILSAGTDYAAHYPDYRGPGPHLTVQKRVDRAAAKGFTHLLAAHEKDYRALFDRVTLDIGQQMPDEPTDKLLAGYSDGKTQADRALEALFFQYGRYLLISSSRAGSLPANLQGVWNHSATPPWNADYHVNINLQMNYWLADPTNLSEAGAPFYDFVDSLVAPGEVAAQRVFGTKGWTLFLNTNVWGYTGLITWPTAFWQPEAGAWLASQYYDHYRYTLDKRFLAHRAYPVMKGAAELWLDALVVDPRDGKLVVSPSYSPEHGPFSAGASMSQEIVFGLFTDVSAAARILHDGAFGAKIDAALARLDPGLRIGARGQLQEWTEDSDDPDDHHRHTSHLYALHPGNQISPLTTPEIRRCRQRHAARARRWRNRLEQGLEDQSLGASARRRSRPSYAVAAIARKHLAQSVGQLSAVPDRREFRRGCRDLRNAAAEPKRFGGHLPALPADWPEGEVRGLKARGAVTVDIAWSKGMAQRVILSTGHYGVLDVQSTVFSGRFSVIDALTGKPVSVLGSGDRRTIAAKKGGRYVVRALPPGEE